MELPVIEVSGDRREIGRQHGEAARARIRTSIGFYQQSFKKASGLSWDEILQQAPRWTPIVEEFLPGIGEELRGIAEGAGARYEEVLALNARGELSHSNPFAESEENAEGCSSYAILPEASADGHTYAGQNWDWLAETAETVILLKITQPGMPTLFMQTEAGQIGRHGANSAGIALNANGLGARFGKGMAIPQPFIRRKILESADMQSALKAVFDSKQSVCTNLVITHRDGFAIDLETTPARHGWMYPTEGILVHTNHFIAFVPEQIAATYRPFSVNSLWRLDRLKRGLEAVRDAKDSAGVYQAIVIALRDHFGYPNSLCKHDDARLGTGDRYHTIASSIVDLTNGDYWLAAGPPCQGTYERIWNVYQEEPATTRPLAAIS
ncbi:MAG: acyl-coenzyme A--6-aminopenicillanic-acid-acyltransferase form [Chloroflexi bacterium]|nr:MAG: acyl-coenzyme A--6-aminopenicillanic-acid-acyltransferase form [Chloroflexota bacterium]